jgi:hypothetical protein
MLSYHDKYPSVAKISLNNARASFSFEINVDNHLFPFYEMEKQKLINDSLNVEKVNSIDLIT